MADKVFERSHFEDPLKSNMNEGEVWITNASDGKSDFWKMGTHNEDEKRGKI